VRRYIVLFILCFIFFFLPLQVYIIGDFTGIGVQGATFRYQVSGYGTSLIPVTRDLMFVSSGIYFGRTALSNILWALGTLLLTCTTLFALINVKDETVDWFRQISYGLVSACLIYICACIAQYGLLFHGPAGFSLPFGILLILAWIFIFYRYPDFFSCFDEKSD